MIVTPADLGTIVNWLAVRDKSLAAIVERHGMPPLWPREPGFPTLLHIILEQQVSLASAKTAFDRLCAAIGPPTPESFLSLDDIQLKAIGFSRQKTRYGRELARAIVTGSLDLENLHSADDDAVRAALTKLPGIGNWTVDVYLLLALRRPDAFASTDLALLASVQMVKNLRIRPTPLEVEAMAEDWRPYRAGAARLLWHAYLSERAARKSIKARKN
jgi:DNA-3-methyladenine glycosylase II